jgi:hypothetical protein
VCGKGRVQGKQKRENGKEEEEEEEEVDIGNK